MIRSEEVQPSGGRGPLMVRRKTMISNRPEKIFKYVYFCM